MPLSLPEQYTFYFGKETHEGNKVHRHFRFMGRPRMEEICKIIYPSLSGAQKIVVNQFLSGVDPFPDDNKTINI